MEDETITLWHSQERIEAATEQRIVFKPQLCGDGLDEMTWMVKRWTR